MLSRRRGPGVPVRAEALVVLVHALFAGLGNLMCSVSGYLLSAPFRPLISVNTRLLSSNNSVIQYPSGPSQ